MIYATSDLHGYPLDDFLRLLDKAHFGDEDFLYVLGDVIDRNGDGGIAMLRWIMSRPNVQLLMGNHEAMMLSCESFLVNCATVSTGDLSALEKHKLALWLQNGARPTILTLAKLNGEDPQILRDILEELRDLSLCEAVTVGDRDFILVHSGFDHFSPERHLRDYTPDELLWCRPSADTVYFPDVMTILGHTPTGYLFGEKGKMFCTDTWIDIDTGAAGGGKPMLLRLDDLMPFYA